MRVTFSVRLPNAVRTSAFRLTVLYALVFGASVLLLLGALSASTVAVLDRLTDEAIEAEIRGLAEQYRQQGLTRLLDVLSARSGDADDQVYLLVDPALRPLAGNLARWPQQAADAGEWIRLTLDRLTEEGPEPREVRARTFRLRGGYRLLVGRDARAHQRFRSTMRTALAWSVAATAILGVGGGVLLSRRVLARVDRVSTTARQIMAGDLARRVETTGSGDEFDRLAHSLNAMLDRIEHLMTGMRLATDSLAHDLRGPLTRLRARIELALRSPSEGQADRQALEEVLSQADAAIALFDGLLAIALAESGAARRQMRPVDLSEIAREAVDLYQPLAEDKGVGLAVIRATAAPLRAEPQFLAQAVANLLDNAVKYTPAGGRVTVAVDADPEAAVLTIADTGPGVPAAARERVLERFVRLEESRSSPGAGLGLSLVAAVCRLHGASILLQDNEPGLRIVLRFPGRGAVSG